MTTWQCGWPVLKWSTATQSSLVPRSSSIRRITSRVKPRKSESRSPSSGATMKRNDAGPLSRAPETRGHQRRRSLTRRAGPASFPVDPVALQITQMRVGALAPEFQPDDPRLHHDAAHPLARPAPLRRKFQPISRRLTPPDAATSPFPGSTPASPPGRRPSPRLGADVDELRFAFVTAFIT